MKSNLFFLVLLLSSKLLIAQNSWNLIQTFNEDINCIGFQNSQNGFLFNSQLLQSTNGGTIWTTVAVPNLDTYISKFFFSSKGICYGIGGNGTVIFSSDNGESWELRNVGEQQSLKSITETPNGTLFVCSTDNKIYKSKDQGKTWSIKETSGSMLYDLAFSDDNVGFAVGLYNTSLKTIDGGDNWTIIDPIIPDRSMFSIKFVNNKDGYVIGGSEIYKTSDGGNSWKSSYTTGGPQLNGIATWGQNIAWVVGSDKILKTIDKGQSWTQQPFSPYNYLVGVSCVDSLTCYTFGYTSLYKTTNGGTGLSIENSKLSPVDFNLLQNYPNPFNPTTTITYFLSNSTKVRLSIFNQLGQEIEVLSDKFQDKGTHTLSYNGSKLASGIYFCILATPSGIKTNQLVLTK
ncbi:MAG: T9SS type A sorting domain-containing protein [Bacteroidetes bacterium]|nr:T9SS type A sorting domain-containing protein [Bacteroidota bacterium]